MTSLVSVNASECSRRRGVVCDEKAVMEVRIFSSAPLILLRPRASVRTFYSMGRNLAPPGQLTFWARPPAGNRQRHMSRFQIVKRGISIIFQIKTFV